MPQETLQRPDGSTVEPEIITFGIPGRKRTQQQITEPVVDPQGNVISALVDTRLREPGLRFVVQREGQLLLTKHARELNMVFYRDMCLGRVPGVAASRVHWAIYEKIRAMVAAGQRPARGSISPEQMYHPEVIRRRALNRDGIERVDEAAMSAILDEIREAAPEMTADEIERESDRLGMTVPDDGIPRSLNSLLHEAQHAG
jgi:hypothetical protein